MSTRSGGAQTSGAFRSAAVLAALLCAAALVLSMSVWGRLLDRVIFQPSPGADLFPETLGIHADEVTLHTEDGVRIHAYFLPAPGASRAILFLHGNAGNASHRLPNAADLMRLGAHVLLLDYRGYGESEGRPSERGVYADARAGLSHLIEERRVAERRIVVFGRSLGGAVAVDLARGRSLAGLVLESTFPSIADVTRSVFGAPAAWLTGRRFASEDKISEVRCPLLFFHGDRDPIVAHELGLRLYQLAPQPKAFETLRGAGHNDTTQVGGDVYFDRLRRFLDEVAPPSAARDRPNT